ncbi:DgyrCDS12371 [Dimorphilus gyrociliatus]|uniref:DgyrCDS12371 n=1 Tax=Dimorphilus gyrociliatus TaxID=2664684 RepID=A0A7I8W698_9ANNE|nr:DgyrCDS12371 [Dimorphilus gyrociliatus]
MEKKIQDDGKSKENDPESKYNWYELHWKQKEELLEWAGNLTNAYRKYYPHLVNRECCLHCGAIPCPYPHDEDKQNRLKDMEFVKDLLNERNKLQKLVSKLKKDMSDFYDKSRAWREEKKELEFNLKELERWKKHHQDEKTRLETEIDKLRGINVQHQRLSYQMRQIEKEKEELKAKITSLEDEKAEIENDFKRCRQIMIRQGDELTELRKEAEVLRETLSTKDEEISNSKREALVNREKAKKAEKQLKDKNTEVLEIKRELESLLKEISEKTQIYSKNIEEKENLLEEFKNIITELTDKITNSDKQIENLQGQVNALEEEIKRLKWRLRNDTKFKQFVQVKRELIDLKSKNEKFLLKSFDSESHFSMLKHENERPSSSPGASRLFVRRSLYNDVQKRQ